MVGTASGMSAQGVAGSHRTEAVPGMVAQWPELADETPVTPTVRHGVLTPSDPCPAVEWLALNASVSWVGEQMGCLFRLSRVASNEAEFPPEPRPRGGLGRGGFERGGDCLLSEGRSLPSSEAEM